MAKYNFDEYGRLDTLSYGRLKEEVKEQLEDFVNDLFYKFQTELDIDNGDIGFDNEFEVECGLEDLTRAIVNSLDFQIDVKAELENEEAEAGGEE